MSDHFSLWLGKKLTELGTDDSVFGPYIISILEVSLMFTMYTVNTMHLFAQQHHFRHCLNAPRVIDQGEDETAEEKEEGIEGILSDVLDDEAVIKATLAQVKPK